MSYGLWLSGNRENNAEMGGDVRGALNVFFLIFNSEISYLGTFYELGITSMEFYTFNFFSFILPLPCYIR